MVAKAVPMLRMDQATTKADPIGGARPENARFIPCGCHKLNAVLSDT